MAQRQFRSDDTSSWSHKFGDGSDGALTISSNTTFSATNEGCSGTSGTTSLTLASAGSFSNGDLVLIHQSRGTGVGNWELNKIASGGGTTSLTMSYDLTNTYTDSGSSQAQIVKLFQYSSVTVNSGVTWSAPEWDGSKGGILAFLCNGLTDINGTISASNKGYLGGSTKTGSGEQNTSGEGTLGPRNQTTNPYGNAAAGHPSGVNESAPGGGNGTAGSNGVGTTRAPGSTSGTASLVTMTFGGGGGGGVNATSSVAVGGDGGGIILIISKEIEIDASTGSIVNAGQNGTGETTDSDPYHRGGGGGAGGSVLIKSQIATLGSSKVTAAAGAGGISSGATTQNMNGGAGGVGRIHLDYATSYTGTTSPTLDVTQDTSLLSANSGIFFTF